MSMRSFNHGDKETRLRTAFERLGSNHPHCLLGHKASPHAMQLHHVAERDFDAETVILCSNHHDPVSDARKITHIRFSIALTRLRV